MLARACENDDVLQQATQYISLERSKVERWEEEKRQQKKRQRKRSQQWQGHLNVCFVIMKMLFHVN
jgi:hypothetical protein